MSRHAWEHSSGKTDCTVKPDINDAGKYMPSMSARTANLHGKGHGCIILIQGWHEVSRAMVQFILYETFLVCSFLPPFFLSWYNTHVYNIKIASLTISKCTVLSVTLLTSLLYNHHHYLSPELTPFSTLILCVQTLTPFSPSPSP